MDLTDQERETLRAMRAITINDEGHEIFVGLDADESTEFLHLSRRNEGGEDLSSTERFMHLRNRHEEARQQIVAGAVSLDDSNLRNAL